MESLTAQVLVLAQAFKGTLSVSQVTDALSAGAIAAGAQVRVVTGSDGGDGLLDALADVLMGRSTAATVGPTGRPVVAPVGWLDSHTAVVESRTACGLSLLSPDEQDPLGTTTRGVGRLVVAAVSGGAETVYVGLGGSATMDGGLGMAREWGWQPWDVDGEPLPEGGGALVALDSMDPGVPPAVCLVGLCDVNNPLLGPDGASVFAVQKGATPKAQATLVEGLERLVSVTGSDRLAGSVGSGAAGGLGFGILYFGGGTLVAGAPWVLDRVGFDAQLAGAAALVVGEGRFDATSLTGKLTGEAISRARRAGVPSLIVAPVVEDPPPFVHVETGGGTWGVGALAEHAEHGIARMLRLLRL